jgi:hypothetical protein
MDRSSRSHRARKILAGQCAEVACKEGLGHIGADGGGKLHAGSVDGAVEKQHGAVEQGTGNGMHRFGDFVGHGSSCGGVARLVWNRMAMILRQDVGRM